MAASLRTCFLSNFIKFNNMSAAVRVQNLVRPLTNNLSVLSPFCNVFLTRSFGTSTGACGIEEFFPAGVLENNEPLPEEVPTGRSWRAGELRQKSNEDLHKLWYVLLKERNMLLTVQWEARRQEVIMPSPERLQKVKKSMAMIKVVIGERTRAIENIERRAREQNFVQSLDNEQDKVQLTDEDKNNDNRQIHIAN